MNKISFDHEYTVQGYITFIIHVIVGDYSGKSSFCISKKNLSEAIKVLKDMNDLRKGQCQLNDYDSDDFILCKFTDIEIFGQGYIQQLQISGQLGGSFNSKYLTYMFPINSEELLKIISDLQRLITK